jgi:hypothetical protein
MAEDKKWIITVSKDRLINEVSVDLVKIGLKDVQTLPLIRVITGSADETTANKIRNMSGVVDVEPETSKFVGRSSDEIW